jgi:glycogenin glucosyltransferase
MATMRSYVTFLSTDDYLDGALVLNASLKRVGSKFGLLALLVGNVSPESEALLNAFGIKTKRVAGKINVPEEVLQANVKQNLRYWNNVFEKLFIFDLTEFDKIVYIDSDMLVLRNIDTLFDSPNMSAVAAGRNFPGNEDWIDLNAGLMVVEPQAGLWQEIVDVLPEACKTGALVSDQTLLHQYYKDWPRAKALHLDEGYNIFADMLDYYAEHLGYRLTGKKKIAIVHFIGEIKPWHRTRLQQWEYLKALRRDGKYRQLMVSLFYFYVLLKVRSVKRMRFG